MVFGLSRLLIFTTNELISRCLFYFFKLFLKKIIKSGPLVFTTNSSNFKILILLLISQDSDQVLNMHPLFLTIDPDSDPDPELDQFIRNFINSAKTSQYGPNPIACGFNLEEGSLLPFISYPFRIHLQIWRMVGSL